MELTGTVKRTGRPVHPLWAHFHRGEKRNRYHYHAFCSYCVARHGVEQVPPTRGVSSDMLRHLESCPNCPRKVVETVKELCGQRERMVHKKNSESRLDEEQVLLLDAVTASSGTIDGTVIEDTRGHKRTASEALDESMSHVDTRAEADKRTTPRGGQNAETATFFTMPTKRGRTESEEDPVTRWRTNLLQLAVAAGFSFSAFQKIEFQELLQVMSPVQVDNDAISSVGSVTFLEETAAKLAQSQLDRVKEGMLNSTIKSGLTLSVTCWNTLDLQNLVAFTLVNSNGDAACVRVEDLGGRAAQYSDESASSMALLHPAQLLPLAQAIEDVLQDLYEKNICVMGIVADSAVALSAANKVCRSMRWRSLLVVPCMSALLASLTGSVLTHEAYRDAVGQLVELAAYFSNTRLQSSLRAMSGENDARIPLPTKEHWFTFVATLTKALHYSDSITAICSSQEEGGAALAPLALRELVLGNNNCLWKTLRELSVLLAPLREAYSLVFQSKPSEINSAYDNDEECATTVHGGLTLAHVMYQLGRMSQQYAALSESTNLNSSSSINGESTTVVAHQLHELLDAMWKRYDLPTMVLAYVFDFHMDSGKLDMSNSALQWKSVSSYFHRYFLRWFCPSQETENQTANSIPSGKVETILNAYQLRQFPFDTDTTSCYTDVSSFYSFVADSHPEICALCCRVYAVALACVDLRRLVRGIGFLPSVAQTTEPPNKVELLLHVGFATNLKKSRRSGVASDGTNILPELLQASRPEELLCSQEEWEDFASDWRKLLDRELAVDELEQLQQLQGRNTSQDKNDEPVSLSLDQLFFEALPPLPAAVVVAPSPHDPSGAITQASVAL
ncbi:hypothetical protein PHMEG_0001044 [Phytophthora megakarya]|uniref:BED-type domain-containing protein n=1 Tax=Phytophthora megakarya TaxID=4795 RepID=A0A225X2P2_9STRA|nr:hypothetical protein PHMEG_0001044 [Phytophthora megakarya]